MSTVRNLTIGVMAYVLAYIANPDASDLRTFVIAMAIVALMFVDELWRQSSGN